MSQHIIQTTQLTRRFGKITAVESLDLQVPRGSVYAFLGPNGAGKTTTIRMLLGLIRPHAGEVRLFDLPLGESRLALLGRVGSLAESPSLYPHLTGRENLEVIRRLLDIHPQAIQRALHTVHLGKDADRLVRGYSQGMRQRLGLAIALLGEPELLILDEPTNGLDPAGIRQMRQLLRQMPGEHGVTVFLSSHLLAEVEQVATHLGIIREGRLIFQGTPDGLHARLGQTLLLGSDQPQRAIQLLSSAGWHVGGNGDFLEVPVNRASDVALINARLVQGGLNVFHLDLLRPSLEDIFLSLTDNTS